MRTFLLKANRKLELVNKVTLKGLNSKFDDAKGLWVELLHEILWSYHITPYYTTTKETPFTMVYGAGVNQEVNKTRLKYVEDLIDELR